MDENSIRQAEIGAVKQLLNLPSDAAFDKTIRSLQKTVSAARKIKSVKAKLGQLLNVADCEVEQMINMFEKIFKENQELKQQDIRQKNLIGQLKEVNKSLLERQTCAKKSRVSTSINSNDSETDSLTAIRLQTKA